MSSKNHFLGFQERQELLQLKEDESFFKGISWMEFQTKIIIIRKLHELIHIVKCFPELREEVN